MPNRLFEKLGALSNSYIYLFLAVLGLHSCTAFSLITASGGYTLVALWGLLIVVASLAAEHEL